MARRRRRNETRNPSHQRQVAELDRKIGPFMLATHYAEVMEQRGRAAKRAGNAEAAEVFEEMSGGWSDFAKEIRDGQEDVEGLFDKDYTDVDEGRDEEIDDDDDAEDDGDADDDD